MQTFTMVLEEIWTSLFMWFFYALIPCLLTGWSAVVQSQLTATSAGEALH
ncbi:IL20RB isoform 1 [Pongo abelii]|uniref:IL20RB isoform 1 n=1 Tax=Pongo abelii TaxID=9601 RepID=A0A2J8TTR6_PONAB|nr:IL20RB isoform 1 [Pongo abelii]